MMDSLFSQRRLGLRHSGAEEHSAHEAEAGHQSGFKLTSLRGHSDLRNGPTTPQHTMIKRLCSSFHCWTAKRRLFVLSSAAERNNVAAMFKHPQNATCARKQVLSEHLHSSQF